MHPIHTSAHIHANGRGRDESDRGGRALPRGDDVCDVPPVDGLRSARTANETAEEEHGQAFIAQGRGVKDIADALEQARKDQRRLESILLTCA